MQTRFRPYVQSALNKTPAYYLEKYIGLLVGLLVAYFCYKHSSFFSFINEKDFTDRLITICITLFGFLLTVLTLIIQSNSSMIVTMKKHGSFKRLINSNKSIIVLSAIVVLISVFSYFLYSKGKFKNCLVVLGAVNVGAFAWALIDTFAFVKVFYKIITSVSLSEAQSPTSQQIDTPTDD